MKRAAWCAVLLVSVASPARADDRVEARALLDHVHEAEPMIRAAIQTRDLSELQRQAAAATRALFASRDRMSGDEKYHSCIRSILETAGLARYLELVAKNGLDAPSLVGLQAVYGRWRTETGDCEAKLDQKRPRQLVLDLG